MAALAYLKKDMDILHREEMESEVMRVLSRNGMIDMTGSLLPGVDGFDTRMNVGIVSMMRQCTAYAVRYSTIRTTGSARCWQRNFLSRHKAGCAIIGTLALVRKQ